MPAYEKNVSWHITPGFSQISDIFAWKPAWTPGGFRLEFYYDLRKTGNCPDITVKLLTGTLNINTVTNKIIAIMKTVYQPKYLATGCQFQPGICFS